MIPTQEDLIKGLITEQVDDNETRMKKVLMDFYNIIDGTFSFESTLNDKIDLREMVE